MIADNGTAFSTSPFVVRIHVEYSNGTRDTVPVFGTSSYHNRRLPEEDLFDNLNRSLRRMSEAIRKFSEKAKEARERTFAALRAQHRMLLRLLRQGIPVTPPLLGVHPQRYRGAYVRPLFKPRVCSLASAYRGRVPTA